MKKPSTNLKFCPPIQILEAIEAVKLEIERISPWITSSRASAARLNELFSQITTYSNMLMVNLRERGAITQAEIDTGVKNAIRNQPKTPIVPQKDI